MKKIALLIVVFLSSLSLIYAQVDQKYLAGAVPEVNGKVVFSTTFALSGLSKADIYQRALEWAKVNYSDEENKVVYTDADKAVISCRGDEDLIFQESFLALDKSGMTYQLNIFCENTSCKVELKSITYTYNVANKPAPEIYKAENWITDKEALNKNKLYRNNGKFRMKTIDLKDEIFYSISIALKTGNSFNFREELPREALVPSAVPVQSQTVAIADPVALAQSPAKMPSDLSPALSTFKKIEPDKIPGNIIKMLNNDWMLITAGTDEKFNMMTASWGGLGMLWQKPVAFCFIHPTRYTYQLMDRGEYYTLSFYTEAYRDALQYCGTHSGQDSDKVKGSGLTPVTMPSGCKSFQEAWLILECKKVLGQQITSDAVADNSVEKEWSGKQFHKMFVGEIIGVWMK